MTRILVVWEDRYFETLDVLMGRAVHACSAPDAVTRPAMVSHTSRSNGGFSRYLRETWPRARANGVPRDPRPFDHMVGVVDADRLHELKGVNVRPKPSDVTATDAWHEEAQRAWQGWLRSQCAPDGPPTTTVHGLVLRWAKESVLLAGFDQRAWKEALGVDISASAAQTELRRCRPDPSKVPESSFTNTFRRPLSCLQLVRKACGLSPLDKNDITIDDTLKILARESLPTVLARVPDLAHLGSLVWSLHQDLPEPEATPG